MAQPRSPTQVTSSSGGAPQQAAQFDFDIDVHLPELNELRSRVNALEAMRGSDPNTDYNRTVITGAYTREVVDEALDRLTSYIVDLVHKPSLPQSQNRIFDVRLIQSSNREEYLTKEKPRERVVQLDRASNS